MGIVSETSGSRPGGRSARVRAAVHHAVEDLVAEGVRTEDLTIPVVAARAGVHATTVYRRWGSVAELLAAVAEHRFTGDVVVPDTGGLGGDLERWAGDVARDLADPDSLALMRASIGAGETASCACTADRRAQITAILDRERARGGAVPEVDAVVDGLLSPLYYEALFVPAHERGPAPGSRVRALVGNLLGQTASLTP
ncbi:TetR-like C-terminal domain-containing protein [Actinomycetospora termitidis]|uniref:TetR-like C-terminal domain-containing protein n=1 Tax=Actinomycetospora termitidis TaxID=3053470 RepID=A0ABT7MF05_9PSEU|nr:TetR-like C-terminal domain-containing protein [Actinomycetospora sp. Odt1-22]MDL5159248.1 TetR-like C-terminal domain-containing protein [Actinomycetospora sp. Odt1-22]